VLLGSIALLIATAWTLSISAQARAQETAITVNASKTGKPISRWLFGLNHRYGFNGYDSFDPKKRRVSPRLVREVRRAGIGWLRYPGGTMANLFHWRRAVGPPRRRGCQVNGAAGGDGGPLSSNYGPDEHMRFVQQIGGTASIVVNFATGTPEEAAAWVQYMNGRVGTSRWADLRARNGHRKPYDVKWWEVSNEPWFPSQQYWMGGEPVRGTSPSTVERYAFGGTTRFTRQEVGTRCDRRPAATLSDGRPLQVKFADYPPVAPGQTVQVAGSAWRRVATLSSARPADRVYALDRRSGRIGFGDGRHGAIPPKGAQITISYRSGPHAGFTAFYRAMKRADPSINVCSSYETPQFVQAMGARHPYDCLVAHPYLLYSTMDPGPAHDFVMAGADSRAHDVGTTWSVLSSFAIG
jgi:alpha-N-arabinofuranosidase